MDVGRTKEIVAVFSDARSADALKDLVDGECGIRRISASGLHSID